MSTPVTLAEVLQAKGRPLEEEEIWALMVLGMEHLLEDLRKGEQHVGTFLTNCSVISNVQETSADYPIRV